MPIADNSTVPGNALVGRVIASLNARLPAGWAAASSLPPSKAAAVDAVLWIRHKDASGAVVVVAKGRLEPKDVDHLAATLRPTQGEAVLVAAPYLSPRTQERLRSRGFAYADLTGNVWLELTQPGLFIETTGARENPEPSPRERKSLKGAKAIPRLRAEHERVGAQG